MTYTLAQPAAVTTWRFFAAGEPKGQPRPRAFVRNGHARVYDAGTAEGWKSCIAIGARGNGPPDPLTGPVSLEVEFFMPRPKGHYGSGRNAHVLKDTAPLWHVGKPDIDNAIKACLDALTMLGAWLDDAQVCSLISAKRYADDHRLGAWITIHDLSRRVAGEATRTGVNNER